MGGDDFSGCKNLKRLTSVLGCGILYHDLNPKKKSTMNYYIKTAQKTQGQLRKFLGVLFPHFSKPKQGFLGDMLYGIQASGDVKLAEISRELDYRGECSPKKKEERLSRHLISEDMTDRIDRAILGDAKKYIKDKTFIVTDPTDIQKRFATKMEGLSKVYDGSKGDVGDNLGYSGVAVVACDADTRNIMPLHLSFWSPKEKDYISDNDKVYGVIRKVVSAIGRKGIHVFDRGGDDIKLFKLYDELGLDFIVRLRGDRNVISWKQVGRAENFARQCNFKYRDKVETEGVGNKQGFIIEYGVIPVRLEQLPGKVYHLVSVRPLERTKDNPEMKPMMLLTSLAKTSTREALSEVVDGYYRRWMVEETIRLIKSEYHLEDIRLLTLRGIKNMASIILASLYFGCVWLGKRIKCSVIFRSIIDLSQRVGELGGFVYYALLHGMRRVLSRGGSWKGMMTMEEEVDDMEQYLPGLDWTG